MRDPLTVTITATVPARGVYAFTPLLAGMVETDAGMVEVDLMLSRETDAPAVFSVTFRTRNKPTGAGYHVDVTDLLEALVRAHFEAHSDDAPIPITESGA